MSTDRPTDAEALAPPGRETAWLSVDTAMIEAFARREPEAAEQVRRQTQEITRALAAQSVAIGAEAEAADYLERVATLNRTMWQKDPVAGYSLRSSLGAFVAAKLAMSWAPPTETRARDRALSKDQLIAALEKHGVESVFARELCAEAEVPSDDFVLRTEGLDAGRLAGLAERTLTIRERREALCQLSLSPRCLSRLAVTAEALWALRHLLPALPAESSGYGAEYVTALSSLILGRPQRTLDLLGLEPTDEALLTLVELAQALFALERGDPVRLRPDPSLMMPALESSGAPTGVEVPTPASGQTEDDEFLEVVEERVKTGSAAPIDPREKPGTGRFPKMVEWGGAAKRVDLARGETWQELRAEMRSPFAELGSVLGLSSPPSPPWCPPVALPPDPQSLMRMIERLNLKSAEEMTAENTGELRLAEHGGIDVRALSAPFFPTARVALRLIVAATEGRAPTDAGVREAGDLSWVAARARAIALVVRGDPREAVVEVAGLAGAAGPEGCWAHGRHSRFAGRKEDALSPEEVRRVAAGIVADLAVQLGKTVAGTLL